ncbi:MAG: nickel pincer cofactor biosynthesis protein LarC [Clostridia bacterium]|nr:nickel pincer cofactor biosynthesis protein LarC [Clostridia bacterium]
MNIYFECNMGAAGDMIASALVDLFEDRESIVAELNSLNLPKTEIVLNEKMQNGISAVHLDVLANDMQETPDNVDEHAHHHHHHHGRGLSDIFGIIDSLNADEKVKTDVKNIYKIVADAEAKAHSAAVGEIHFHELGMLDAIADITASAFLLKKLGVEKVTASPINVGNGSVRCAHGLLPVPAPATANILLDVPYYKSDVDTELCTPTGAAILKYYANKFLPEPLLTSVKKVGVGAGTKELDRANIIRAFLYEDSSITELSCNVDDITGEEIAFAVEKMMSEGALDCFVTPVVMKKGRPAFMLTVLCKNSEADKFASLIFKHTTTIGLRKYTPSRYTLKREFVEENGVAVKRSEGFCTSREKIEFEDIKALAVEKDISVFEARKELEDKSQI